MTGADGDLPTMRNWDDPEHVRQLAEQLACTAVSGPRPRGAIHTTVSHPEPAIVASRAWPASIVAGTLGLRGDRRRHRRSSADVSPALGGGRAAAQTANLRDPRGVCPR